MSVRATLLLVVSLGLAGCGAPPKDWTRARLEGVEQTRFGWLVQRVYPVLRRNDECQGVPVDDCLRPLGTPSNRSRLENGDERIVYEGKKELYRGSGAANHVVARERREFIVHDGLVIDAFDVLQVVEIGPSWAPDEILRLCERYGSTHLGNCGGDVTPVDAEQPPRQAPAAPLDFGCGARERPPAVTGGELAGFTSDDLLALVRDALPMQSRVRDAAPGSAGVFLGQERGEAVTASCARSVHVAFGDPDQWMVVAVCDRTSELTWQQLCDARARLTHTALLLDYQLHGPQYFPDVAPRHERLPGGFDVLRFAPFEASRRFTTVPTAIVTDDARRYAVVVQLEDAPECRGRAGCEPSMPIVLTIARRVAEALRARA